MMNTSNESTNKTSNADFLNMVLSESVFEDSVTGKVEIEALGNNLISPNFPPIVLAMKELFENGIGAALALSSQDISLDCKLRLIHEYDKKTKKHWLFFLNNGDYVHDEKIESLASYGDTSKHKETATAANSYDTGYKAAHGYLKKGKNLIAGYITRLPDGTIRTVDCVNWPVLNKYTNTNAKWGWSDEYVTCFYFAFDDGSILEGYSADAIARMFMVGIYNDEIHIVLEDCDFGTVDLNSYAFKKEFFKHVTLEHIENDKVIDGKSVDVYRVNVNAHDEDEMNEVKPWFRPNEVTQGIHCFVGYSFVENSFWRLVFSKREDEGRPNWRHPGLNHFMFILHIKSIDGKYMGFSYSNNNKTGINWDRRKPFIKELANFLDSHDRIGHNVREAYRMRLEYQNTIRRDNSFLIGIALTGKYCYVAQYKIAVKEVTDKNGKAKTLYFVPDGVLFEYNDEGKPDYSKPVALVENKNKVYTAYDVDQNLIAAEMLGKRNLIHLFIGESLDPKASEHIDNLRRRRDTTIEAFRKNYDELNAIYRQLKVTGTSKEILSSLEKNISDSKARLDNAIEEFDAKFGFIETSRIDSTSERLTWEDIKNIIR